MIRITTDGTPKGTHLFDTDTGNEISKTGITGIDFQLDALKGLSAQIRVWNIGLDLTGLFSLESVQALDHATREIHLKAVEDGKVTGA